MTIEEIVLSLECKLKPERFNHSLGVADTARTLAVRYGASPDKAYLAGVLHDCAKYMTQKELCDRVEKYNINLDSVSLRMPQILHSFVGAYEAREVYGINDEEIFDAIYYHTIGKCNMSVLTKIIYLADAIEPGRTYPDADYLRQLANEDLDKAVYEYTKTSLRFILKKGSLIHPNAVDIINSHIIGY